MKIILYLKMGAQREIGNVLRRSPECTPLRVIMLILNTFNMQNPDEHFPVEGLEMLWHHHSAWNIWGEIIDGEKGGNGLEAF